jgi:hypothetical protein
MFQGGVSGDVKGEESGGGASTEKMSHGCSASIPERPPFGISSLPRHILKEQRINQGNQG